MVSTGSMVTSSNAVHGYMQGASGAQPVGKLAVKISAESPKDLAPRQSSSICLEAFLTSISCPNLKPLVALDTWL